MRNSFDDDDDAAADDDAEFARDRMMSIKEVAGGNKWKSTCDIACRVLCRCLDRNENGIITGVRGCVYIRRAGADESQGEIRLTT